MSCRKITLFEKSVLTKVQGGKGNSIRTSVRLYGRATERAMRKRSVDFQIFVLLWKLTLNNRFEGAIIISSVWGI